ncbi:hypothetical protein JCM5296_003051 [Sporobolomyces johnsonii]
MRHRPRPSAMSSSLRLAPVHLPLLALSFFSLPMATTAAIIGTESLNISSDSTQLTYVGTWRSDNDTQTGAYQAYSNASDASVTFSFIGVAVAYVAEKKADRGLCQLTVDATTSYTIDLYNDSGYSQGFQIIWDSGTLVYGAHNVTISQIGPDARFGYYPYLITETWIESVPTNVPAYTATQIIPSSTASATPEKSHKSDAGPIIGGVVGGVVACFLLGFLLYLWRRDKAQRRRSEGAPVQKVKKAEGKMAIEDEPEPTGGAGWAGAPGGAVAGGAAYGRYDRGGPDGQYYGSGYDNYGGYGREGYGGGVGGGGGGGYGAGWAHNGGREHSAPGTDDDSHHHPRASSYRGAPYGPYGHSHSPSPSSPGYHSYPSTGAYDTMSSQNKVYPYHEQGFGTESRRYPVPEI